MVDCINKKSLFQVKLIISNNFFLAGTQGFEFFPGAGISPAGGQDAGIKESEGK